MKTIRNLFFIFIATLSICNLAIADGKHEITFDKKTYHGNEKEFAKHSSIAIAIDKRTVQGEDDVRDIPLLAYANGSDGDGITVEAGIWLDKIKFKTVFAGVSEDKNEGHPSIAVNAEKHIVLVYEKYPNPHDHTSRTLHYVVGKVEVDDWQQDTINISFSEEAIITDPNDRSKAINGHTPSVAITNSNYVWLTWMDFNGNAHIQSGMLKHPEVFNGDELTELIFSEDILDPDYFINDYPNPIHWTGSHAILSTNKKSIAIAAAPKKYNKYTPLVIVMHSNDGVYLKQILSWDSNVNQAIISDERYFGDNTHSYPKVAISSTNKITIVTNADGEETQYFTGMYNPSTNYVDDLYGWYRLDGGSWPSVANTLRSDDGKALVFMNRYNVETPSLKWYKGTWQE